MNDMTPHDAPATSPAPATVRIERVLPGPIERVWKYITAPELRKTWFAGGDFELRPGGAVTLEFDHANLSREKVPPPRHADKKGAAHGTITECDPPRLLAFDWKMGQDMSHVTFELSPEGGDTRLVITHVRLEPRNLVLQVAGGWDAHLTVLAARLSGREPPGFWSLIERLERDYEARL